jgi:hypothetical protein
MAIRSAAKSAFQLQIALPLHQKEKARTAPNRKRSGEREPEEVPHQVAQFRQCEIVLAPRKQNRRFARSLHQRTLLGRYLLGKARDAQE